MKYVSRSVTGVMVVYRNGCRGCHQSDVSQPQAQYSTGMILRSLENGMLRIHHYLFIRQINKTAKR